MAFSNGLIKEEEDKEYIPKNIQRLSLPYFTFGG